MPPITKFRNERILETNSKDYNAIANFKRLRLDYHIYSSRFKIFNFIRTDIFIELNGTRVLSDYFFFFFNLVKCIYTLLSITDDRVYSKKKTIVNTDKRKEICSRKSK